MASAWPWGGVGHPPTGLPRVRGAGHPRGPRRPPETGLSWGGGAVESAGPRGRRMLTPEQEGPAACLAGRCDDLVRFWGAPGAVFGASRCLERRGTGRRRGPFSCQGRGCLCPNPRSTPLFSTWRSPISEEGSRPRLPPQLPTGTACRPDGELQGTAPPNPPSAVGRVGRVVSHHCGGPHPPRTVGSVVPQSAGGMWGAWGPNPPGAWGRWSPMSALCP